MTPVRHKPGASMSQVKHSTTEPLRSLKTDYRLIQVKSIAEQPKATEQLKQENNQKKQNNRRKRATKAREQLK